MKHATLRALVLDTLLPDQCVLCETLLRPRTHNLLCLHCDQTLPRNDNACQHCGLPLAQDPQCGSCFVHPLTTGRTVTPLLHKAEGKHLVGRLKFAHGMREGWVLSQLMYAAVCRDYAQDILPQAIIPTPMSWRATLVRGHNQANYLAHRLSRLLQLKFLPVLRKQHRPPQRTLSRAERLRLPARTFRVARSLPYSHVAVVDDVLTTGSTMRAIIAQLEKQGVERIDIWCATRAT